MKLNYLILIVVTIGFITLYIFPEPEANFLAYTGTALFFIILTIFLIIWRKRKNNKTSK